MAPVAPYTRARGLARLAAFAPKAGESYTRGRNYDRGDGAAAAVSGLSPFVQRRLVGEDEVIAAVLAEHRPQAAEKFLQEVIWRTYWKGWLEHHPAAWEAFREEAAASRARGGRAQAAAVARAERGETGIACFDAWAQALTATGLLHNHVRMWFASIWIFTLKLPWALGTDFFYRHLHDGDPASNTLSWRWVAGLHTRGKIYLASSDNIARYTEGRFPHTPNLAQAAAPVAAAADFAEVPVDLTGWQAAPSGRVGLLLTPEDLSPEHGELAELKVAAAAALDPAWLHAHCGLAEHAVAAGEVAVADACARAEAHYGVKVERLAMAHEADALRARILAWAERERLLAVVLARPFVGPWLDLLGPLLASPAGTPRLLPFRRAHDRAWFPHATRGFFRLKRRLPEAVARGSREPVQPARRA